MLVSRQKRLFTSVRPARVAVFVPKNDPHWQATCTRVIEYFSAGWGGGYNIIVPTDGTTIEDQFLDILRIYDPDYLFLYYHTWHDIKISNRQVYEQKLDAELQHFISSGPISDVDSARKQIDEALKDAPLTGRPSSELEERLIKNLAPFHIAEHAFEKSIGVGSMPAFPLSPLSKLLPNVEHRDRIATYESRYESLYPLWLASVTGLVTENFKQDLDSLGIAHEIISMNDYGPVDLFVDPSNAALRRAQRQLATPFELANTDTGLYQPVKVMPQIGPLVLVAGDTVSDFCLYYSLAKLRHSVLWLPLEFLKSQQETDGARVLLDGYVDLLKDVTSMAQVRDPKYVVLSASHENVSNSVIGALDEAGYGRSERISDSLSPGDLKTLIQHPLRLYELDNVYRPTSLVVSDNAELDFFDTPRPKNFTRLDPYENRWIAEINIPAHQLPRNRHLGKWVVRHPTSSSNTARISRSGISYFCPNSAYFGGDIDTSLVRPTIYIPDAFQTFKYLFDREGYTVSPSDKGFFARDSVQKFGTLSTLANLIRPTAIREMLLKFLDHVKPGRGVFDEGAVLNDKRRYLNLPAISKFIGNDAAAQATIEVLVTAQVLYRGFVFKCRFCRNADWFSLDEVSQSFKCKRCGRTQGISSENYWYGQYEPGWFYKLDEIVFQFLRHNGYVTLLALDHLQRKALDSFLYTPDMELTKKGASTVTMELDILCIPDGVLVIGEAKQENKLGNSKREEIDTIQRYARLAKQIGSEALVFATFADKWSDKTLEHIRKHILDCKVILLTQTELLDTNG